MQCSLYGTSCYYVTLVNLAKNANSTYHLTTIIWGGAQSAGFASHGPGISKSDVKLAGTRITSYRHYTIRWCHSGMNEGVSLSHFCSPCVDLMTELGEGLREGGRGDESEIMGVCTDRMDASGWRPAKAHSHSPAPSLGYL